LEFATLDEAQFCGGVFPVPLQFSYDDPASRKSRDILVGANDDLPRPSDRPFVFSFARDGVATSIIDSPGLGRVVENDDSLVRQLLTFASSFQSVDMILLLIHNDQLRLTDTFEHTFNVILRNLHDSALKNVAFCFTNAKLSNYRPGDAFSVLIKQLQSNNWPDAISLGRNNVFCMDNEAIRYLAAVKHGIEHDVEMKKSIESSWEHAKTTAQKIVQCASALQPITKLLSIPEDGL
jgi:hypothetical protein